MDVYISGKISGKTQQEAEADFGKYAEIIQAAGHTPAVSYTHLTLPTIA